MMIPMMVPELLDEVFFVQEVDFFLIEGGMQCNILMLLLL